MNYELEQYKRRLAGLEALAKERYPDLEDVPFVEHATNAWMRCAWQLGATQSLARDAIAYAADFESSLPDIIREWYGDRDAKPSEVRQWCQKHGYLPEDEPRQRDTEATVGPIRDQGCPFETGIPR